MRKLEKIKKNFVINTELLKNKSFNEPVYIINSTKEYVEVYRTQNKKVKIEKITLDEDYSKKTFITVSDFFRKCKKDGTEYKIEKVDNGDVYIRVAFLGDISLFYRYRNGENKLIMTNIKNYKFDPTQNNTLEALNNISNLNYYNITKINGYLSSLKNLKRDYIYALKKSLENLEKIYKNQ